VSEPQWLFRVWRCYALEGEEETVDEEAVEAKEAERATTEDATTE
jgi:hypothetical protein